MKKIILSIMLAYTGVANAGTYMLNDGKKVETPYKLMVMDGVTDLEVASYLGKVDYIKNALKQDPLIVKKINLATEGSEDSPLGFNSRNVDTLSLMIQSDPELLNRKNADNRNIAINLMIQYFEFYHSAEAQKEVNKLIVELEKNKFPFVAEAKTALTKGRGKQEMEALAIHLINTLDKKQLNEQDKWGNTVLSYAVYTRSANVVKALLSHPNFRSANTANKLNENALFMLLSNNCNVNNEQSAELVILKELLFSRVNAFGKNNKGVSFAGFIGAFPEFHHLKEIVSQKAGPLRQKMAEKDSANLKEVIKQNGSRNVKDSFVSPFSKAQEYSPYTCDVKKLKY